ncbi:VirB4 family type IV secretion system protein [Paraburkholderia sp. MM5477-R1]|uniref:VirB4 family type IV secretion system protein n=1 Tax=Paraburkholderia sp. MM5477-R1 TaxID=2991062 RepID=UPI003D1B7CD9
MKGKPMEGRPAVSSEILGAIGAVEDWLPKFGHPVTKHVQHLEGNRFMVTLAKRGVPFEVHENEAIERMFDRDTETYSKLGRDLGGRLGYHAVFTRRRVSFEHAYRFRPRFMQWFASVHVGKFHEEKFFENRYYLSLILKYEDFDDGLKEIESLAQQALLQFADYEADLLEVYGRKHMNGTPMLFSRQYGFISDLVNAVQGDLPVAAEPGTDIIPSSYLHFGYNALSVQGPGVPASRQFATCYDLRGCPDKPGWGQLDPIISLPVELTVAHSFNCMTGFESNRTIDSTINKLESAGDKAKHQVRELRDAQGYVNTGELSFGEYHGAAIVYGETAKEALENGNLLASRSLSECGVEWALATGSAPFTYFSQVPAARVKPRPKVQSSRNFASMHACHDYSTGKAEGNPIGDGSAIIPFRSASGMYHYNHHATRRGDINVAEKLAAHNELKGTTGTGKSMLAAAITGMLSRFDPLLYVLDKGRGWEVLIRAMGGAYVNLEKGKPTGWAPFELADTPDNREFLYGLTELCGRKNGVDHQGRQIRIDLTASEKIQCRNAVDAVMGIEDVRLRRFSLLLDSIPDEGDDSLRARLSLWCKSEGGRFWWVFDNPPNLSLNMSEQRWIGFDVEAFLVENYEPSEPAFAYLFHLKKLMRSEGRLMQTVIEEYWLPIRFRTIREQIEETLASGRKEGEFLTLITQQPEQGQKAADLFPALRSLVATKLWMADPAAEEEAYLRDGMTKKEFREFRKLTPQARRFLIKQGNQSAFASFDLTGLDDAIAVFSGDRENVLICDAVRAELGDDPDVWLPVYLERVFERKLRTRLAAKHGADERLWNNELQRGLERKRAELAAIYPPARTVEADADALTV